MSIEKVADLPTPALVVDSDALEHNIATMAAALVKPTSGIVLIGEYDPRVQPVHCKRIAAYVPHDPLPFGEMSAEHFIDYRAALWDIDPERARAPAHPSGKIARSGNW